MTLVQIAAIVGTVFFSLLAIFQIALLLGAPLGEFAWGGQQKNLDPNRRVGSGLNIVLYGVFSLLMLARAGFIHSAVLEPILPFALWMMVAFASVGIFLNAITRSRKERAVMLPTAIVLFACQLIVAIG
jgi:thiol:disulfide interchange protein